MAQSPETATPEDSTEKPEVAAAEPLPTPAQQPDPVPPALAPRRRGGFVPMVFGGVLAAAIGAGATIYLLPRIPPEWLPLPQTPQVDEAALRAAIADQAARIESLGAELAAIKGQPDLSGALGALDARVAQIEARPSGGSGDPAALAALQADLEALRQRLDQAAGAGTDAAREQIAAAAEAAAQRIAEAEAEAQRLRDEAAASARRTMAQAALARLAAALDSGLPADAAIADLQTAGVTVPAEVQAEIPSLRALQDAFPEAARAALAAARKAAATGTTMDRLGAFLMAQTGARSLQPKEGSDPDAILSRVEAALTAGNLAEALREIATLSPEGQAAMAPWVEQAQRRLAATDALGALAQSLN